MAESRRSRRSSKEVSYSSLDGNDDSDDDFADFTPPPTKKSRKRGAKKPTDKSKQTRRKALTERKAVVDYGSFDEELQLALAMSKEVPCPQTVTSKTDEKLIVDISQESARPKEEILVDIHVPEMDENELTREPESENKLEETRVTEATNVKPTNPNEKDEDRISFIETVDPETEENPTGRGQRRAAKTATSKQRALLGSDDERGDDDSGDEYKADDRDLEESDGENDDDEGDEDFSFSPKKKKQRKGSGGKAARKETAKRKPAAKRDTKKKGNENAAPKPVVMRKTPLPKRSQSKSFTPPSVTSNSATKSPNLLAVRQIKRSSVVLSPKDSNDNNPLGGVRLVSPGQPFRLGLSRFARVKSLHSNP